MRSIQAIMGPAIVALAFVACAPPAGQLAGSADARQPARGKQVTAAIISDLPSMSSKVTRAIESTSVPGGTEIERLLNSSLTITDEQNRRLSVLAANFPTIENGLWKLLPDGRMETTWQLRENARWQDGTRLTAADLVFTAQVERDKELVVFRDVAYDSVESVEAPDDRTLTVKWTKPYIDADAMFSLPLPKHLLEEAYNERKDGFLSLPYWFEQYVGTGPYRLKDWQRSVQLTLSAYDDYPLGRAKIDEITIKFIIDPATALANVMAGTVELILGRSLSTEQAVAMRDQWTGGRAVIDASAYVQVMPQFLDPSPAVISDVRFRKALMYALDRQTLADTLQYGLVPAADSFLPPIAPEYPYVESQITKYSYDPRQAAQLLQELGYAKAAEGSMRDPLSNQKLGVEIRTLDGYDVHFKVIYPLKEQWEQAGVSTDVVVVPRQRQADREYAATFPGFLMYRQPTSFNSIKNLKSSLAPVAANGFVGGNYARYTSKDLDGLVDQAYATIPYSDRMNVLGQIVHLVTDSLIWMPTIFDTSPVLIGNRLVNAGSGRNTIQTWNAYQWELTS
jgi:peptide/nickel transport system substrate-binding protein